MFLCNIWCKILNWLKLYSFLTRCHPIYCCVLPCFSPVIRRFTKQGYRLCNMVHEKVLHDCIQGWLSFLFSVCTIVWMLMSCTFSHTILHIMYFILCKSACISFSRMFKRCMTDFPNTIIKSLCQMHFLLFDFLPPSCGVVQRLTFSETFVSCYSET